MTHASFVYDYHPLKEEAYHIRIIVRGDYLPYTNNAGSLAANLLEIKILLNSTISDTNKDAHFMLVDIKDHFLATPMKNLEYMQVKYQHIPINICQQYNLDSKLVQNDLICIRIKKGMLGLW